MNLVFSIGHSDHTADAFVALLARHGVTAVADVRAAPYSRHHPQFSKAALIATLRAAGLAYVYLGEQLGGLPSARVRGQMQGSGYAAMAATEAFQEGIARVGQGRERHRIALMCAERDPIDCHRALLVGRALVGAGVGVEHIHSDGTTEGQAALEHRLMEAAGCGEGGDLFATPSQLLDLAYLRQEKRAGLIDEEQGGA